MQCRTLFSTTQQLSTLLPIETRSVVIMQVSSNNQIYLGLSVLW